MRYSASEPGMLSLRPKDKVVIYSYPAGDNPNLLGVEVGSQLNASVLSLPSGRFVFHVRSVFLWTSHEEIVMLAKLWIS